METRSIHDWSESRRNYTKHMQGKIYNFIDKPLRLALSMKFDMNTEGKENIPEGGFFGSSKHCYIFDGLFTTLAMRETTDVLPSFPMREVTWFGSNFPSRLLEFLGTRLIYKPRIELNGLKDKDERKRIKVEGRLQNETVERYMQSEMARGGVVVGFPEGKMMPGRMFPDDGKKLRMRGFETKYFNLANEAEILSGTEVPVLPIGIEYTISNKTLGKNQVTVRFGEPLHFGDFDSVDGLVSRCYDSVKELSGL